MNEAGNYCIADEYVVADIDDNARLVAQQQRWDLNYREAAVYLQEGENNDKFSTHPSRQVFLSCLVAHILGQFSSSGIFSNYLFMYHVLENDTVMNFIPIPTPSLLCLSLIHI